MPTIKDVAKLAGVSISTASYALNHLPKVHPETKKRIFEAAKTLNYYPNGIARNLKTRRTKNIGVFIYGFAGPIFSDVLEGIRQTLQENQFNIVVSSGKSSANLLKERQIDGAIIFDNELSDEVIKNYASYGLPVYVLDRTLEGDHIYSSIIDNEGLVNTFIKEMIEKGYKDFGYLSGPKVAFNNNRRYEGFLKALETAGIKSHQHYDADFTIQGGYKVGKALISSEKRPKFIYCANDESAIGLMQALKEANIRIPEDIAIAGFDNIFLGEYMAPKLTTIGINHIAWGKTVASAILDIINNQEIKTIEHPEGMIIYRESC